MKLTKSTKAALVLLVGCVMTAGNVTGEEKTQAPAAKSDAAKGAGWKSEPGTYAVLDTSEGKVVLRFFEKEAPASVESFIGLAEGTKEFTDPVSGSKAKRPYFDGTKFHRIIPGFMMQGGDPTGTGTGGPGFTIKDEWNNGLGFDRPGRVGVARKNQPNTAGSQFFITQVPYPSLSGQYTVFGQVVEGQEVVDHVCKDIGTSSGKPTKDVILKKVTIERVK
jgi:cyclophilin family peptidyl-prolyl cis-trans isomerase